MMSVHKLTSIKLCVEVYSFVGLIDKDGKECWRDDPSAID